MEAKGGAGRLATIRDAEQLMLGASEYLSAMPDRERAFLTAGGRTAWPPIVQEVFDAYDSESETSRPRVHVGKREADLVARMLTGENALALAVPVDQRQLLGRVLAAKLWGIRVKGEREKFTWELMWDSERRRCRAKGERMGVTTDGLRARYERALAKVAVAIGRV